MGRKSRIKEGMGLSEERARRGGGNRVHRDSVRGGEALGWTISGQIGRGGISIEGERSREVHTTCAHVRGIRNTKVKGQGPFST